MQVLENAPLAHETTLGVGGRARYFCEVSCEAELVEAVSWAQRRGISLRVLGGGSNIVVADSGFDGLVIKIGLTGIDNQVGARGQVEVMAGESWHEFVMSSVRGQQQGVECLAGIPGLVGATPIQNVGAYGQEVCESIVQVVAFDTQAGSFRSFDRKALQFGYRDSFFKRQDPAHFVVTRVRFCLNPGAPAMLRYAELQGKVAAWAERHGHATPSLADVARLVLELRRAKSMLLDPTDENRRSCGSFFVNPQVTRGTFETLQQSLAPLPVPNYPAADGQVKLSAAWLIEQAGFEKGTRRGNVGLSTKHSLALVCHEGASAAAVLDFAHEVRHIVEHRFGIRLVAEPVLWGFDELEAGLPKKSRLPGPAS